MTSVANILINSNLVENLNQNFDIIGNSINTNSIKNFNQTSLIELDTKINVEADILPTSNNNINLGSSLNEFKNIYGQISSGTQSNISSLPGLLSVQNQSVAPSSWQYLNTMNQAVSTTSNVDFGQVEAKGRLQVLNSSDAVIMDVNTTTPQVTINCDTLINGNITYNTITELKTIDPMISLASGNLTNSLDIGFYGEYATDGKTPIYTGIYRDHTNSRWTFYDNLGTAPGSTVGTSYTLSSLKGNSYFANYGFLMVSEPNTGLLLQNPAELIISVTGSNITKFEPSRITVSGDCKSTTFSIGATSLNSTSWGYLSTVNQNLGTSNSPQFSAVTATTFNGSLNGNASTATSSTTAGTVTNPSQSAITTLDNLTSVATKSINGTQWTYLSNLDQNINSTAAALFASVTTTTGLYSNNYYGRTSGVTFNLSGTFFNVDTSGGSTVNFGSGTNNLYINNTGKTSFGTNLNPSNKQVYISGDLEATGDIKSATFSIGATSLNSTSWGYLNAINQNLGTTNNVSFRNITPQATATYDLGSTGALWNNIYVNNIYGTIAASAGSQINILEVGSLSRVGAITGYTSGIWQFVRDMQNVSTTATPTFATLTLGTTFSTGSTATIFSNLHISSNASGTPTAGLLKFGSSGSANYIQSGLNTTLTSSAPLYFTNCNNTTWGFFNTNGGLNVGTSTTDSAGSTFKLYSGGAIATEGVVQVNNTVKAQTYRGGVVAEDSTNVINIGINEDSAARFGGSYVSGSQGGMLRIDTRSGQPLFSFLTRAAGSTGAVSSVLNIPATVSTTTGTTLGIDGSNNLIRISSSARYKKNIIESKVDSSKIWDLDIREFDYKDTDVHDVGLIAEEVEEILPELVIYGKDSEGAERPDSVKYDRLSLLLLEELKKIKISLDSANTLIESHDIRLLALENTP